jgi:hypothetical protein
LDAALLPDAQVLLTPNYYPEGAQHLAAEDGYFNAGFVLTRTRRFHEWWRDAFTSQPWKFADQACLNEAPDEFSVVTLGECANIGFWRSKGPVFRGVFKPIPEDCQFLHVHMFRPLSTSRKWIDKMFAVHCLSFLRASPVPEHQILHGEILSRDPSGSYKAALSR